jgi:amino acid transporter
MTETPLAAEARPGIRQQLAQGKLGTLAVSGYELGSIGPLMVAMGVIATAIAVTGITSGVPLVFILVGFFLALFLVGYIKMGRRAPNAGAFYAVVTRGLGRVWGVVAALFALVVYNPLQFAIYGMLGPQLASFLQDNGHTFGLHLQGVTWFEVDLVVWALVMVLGLAGVDVSRRLLAVCSGIEIVLILTLCVCGLASPASGHLSVHAFSVTSLSLVTFGVVAGYAVLSYGGIEQGLVYAEEAKEPRTVSRASYLCLGLVVVAYVLVGWALPAHYGPGVVGIAQTQGASMFPAMGPAWLGSATRCFFLTSLLAAALSYHNACWRYTFSLSRDGILPRMFSRVAARGVPPYASLAQSLIGLIALIVTRARHLDPTDQLFFEGGVFGGLGVLGLFWATSIAQLREFHREPGGESLFTRVIAPGLALAGLSAMLVDCVAHLHGLLGVTSGDPSAARMLVIYAVTILVGLTWAGWLRWRRPKVFARLGHGPAPLDPASPTVAKAGETLAAEGA